MVVEADRGVSGRAKIQAEAAIKELAMYRYHAVDTSARLPFEPLAATTADASRSVVIQVECDTAKGQRVETH